MNENLKKKKEIGQCLPKKLIDQGRNHRENCKIQTKMQTKWIGHRESTDNEKMCSYEYLY